MPSTQVVATLMVAGILPLVGFALLQHCSCSHQRALSKVVFSWCGKVSPPVYYVALSAVEEVLYVAIGHWADRKSTVRTMTVANQYLLACVDVQSWSFVSSCVWKSRLGARRVCTECVKGWEKMSCQKHCEGDCEEQCSECVSMIFPACVSGLRQDKTTLPSESKSTL